MLVYSLRLRNPTGYKMSVLWYNVEFSAGIDPRLITDTFGPSCIGSAKAGFLHMLPRLLVCLLVAHRLAYYGNLVHPPTTRTRFFTCPLLFPWFAGHWLWGKVILAILSSIFVDVQLQCHTIPSCSECLRRLGVKTLPEIPFCLYFGCKSKKSSSIYTTLPLPSLCNFRNSLGVFLVPFPLADGF